MQIRKAKIGDVPKVAELAVDFMRYLAKLDPYFAPARDAKKSYLGYFKKSIYSKDRLLLVAEDGKKIIGYALAKISKTPPVMKVKRYGMIYDVYLERKYRRRGVAGQFLEEIYAWFKSKKITNVELYVLPKNDLGRKAWKK